MEIRNCPECGKVFTYLRTSLCPACQAIDEENYRKVRQFLYRNPGMDIQTVSEKTGVSEEKIIRYLKDGRISNLLQASVKLECEVCGAPITTGRYCKSCGERLVSGLKRSIEEENRKELKEMNELKEIKETKEIKTSSPRMHSMEYWRERKER